MILSKSSLHAVLVTIADRQQAVLDNVRIEEDGTVITCNGKSIIAVSPVPEDIKKEIPLTEGDFYGATISSTSIREVIKNIPRDTMFGGRLEFCDVSGDCTVEMTDGKRRKQISMKTYTRPFISFVKVFRMLFWRRDGIRAVVDLKRLALLIESVKKIAGEVPVFLEVDKRGNIIVRAVHPVTGQRIVGATSSYKGDEGKWLEINNWEKGLTKSM